MPCITVTVVSPANITIESFDVSPKSVQVNQNVTITVVLRNSGGVSGSVTLKITDNGNTIKQESVTVPANQSVSKSYTMTMTTVGTHNICAEITQ